MKRPFIAAAALLLAGGTAVADRCAAGSAANEQEDWQWLQNNAARTADEYAVDRDQPNATPAFGDISVVYQEAGEHRGQYLVVILDGNHIGTSFMMLKPRFDFCGDISGIDDEDPNLFEVVVAKFDGLDF